MFIFICSYTVYSC